MPPPKQLLLTAGHAVAGAVKPAVQAVTGATQSVANKVVDMHAKTHPKRRWVFWLVGILIIVVLGGGAYWLFFGRNLNRPVTETTLPISPFLRTSDIVVRNSQIPTGSLTYSGNQLVPSVSNLSLVDPNYTLGIQLLKTESGETAVYGSFTIDPADGTLLDEKGEEITGVPVDDVSEFDTARIILNPINPDQAEAVILTGEMPSKGQKSTLQFPFEFKAGLGRVVASYSEDLKKYSVGIELSGLADVTPFGWKYTAWLADLEGPYVKKVKSLGSFFAGKGGKANHEFSSADALASYDTVVVSLEPADDGDQIMSPIRILSAFVDLK